MKRITNLFIFILLSFNSYAAESFTIYPHKGAPPDGAIANTLKTFSQAVLKRGYEALEIDLRYIDSKWQSSHPWENDIARYYGTRDLKTVLCKINQQSPKIKYNLDIKDLWVAKDKLEDVFAILKQCNINLKRVIFTSGLPKVISDLRAINKNAKIALDMTCRKWYLCVSHLFKYFTDEADYYSVDFGSYSPDEISKLNKPVILWTVNDPDLIKQYKKAGAFGIITDIPVNPLK